MMQGWNKILAALSSTSTPTRDDAHTNPNLVRVILEPGGTAFVSLLDTFKTLHHPRLFITSPDSGSGTKFAIAALKINSTLHSLTNDGTAAVLLSSQKSALNLVQVHHACWN